MYLGTNAIKLGGLFFFQKKLDKETANSWKRKEKKSRNWESKNTWKQMRRSLKFYSFFKKVWIRKVQILGNKNRRF